MERESISGHFAGPSSIQSCSTPQFLVWQLESAHIASRSLAENKLVWPQVNVVKESETAPYYADLKSLMVSINSWLGSLEKQQQELQEMILFIFLYRCNRSGHYAWNCPTHRETGKGIAQGQPVPLNNSRTQSLHDEKELREENLFVLSDCGVYVSGLVNHAHVSLILNGDLKHSQ